MHSIIKESCFLEGKSQDIIKKLTDKKLKEVAPNIWELNSEQSIWMADMWADEKDGFMCGYRMGFQDMVENPTRFDGIPYYNSVYICTKEGKERILCKYKEIFLFEKVDSGYEFKGVYSLDGGIFGDTIWFKRKSSLSGIDGGSIWFKSKSGLKGKVGCNMKSEIKNYIIGKEVNHITNGQGIVEKYEERNNGNSYIYVNFIKTNKTIMMAYPLAFKEHLIISGEEINKIIKADLLECEKSVSNAQPTNQKETIKSGWRRDNCAGYELVNYLLKTKYASRQTSIWEVTSNLYIWLPRIDGKERNGWCNYFENGNTNTIIEENRDNRYSLIGLDHPYRWVFDRKDNGFVFMGVYKLREPESTNMKRILDKVNDEIKI